MMRGDDDQIGLDPIEGALHGVAQVEGIGADIAIGVVPSSRLEPRRRGRGKEKRQGKGTVWVWA